MESITSFDYIKLKSKDIFIVRFNNTSEQYLIASLIYQHNAGIYNKIKPYISYHFKKTAGVSRFDFAERNVFIIKYYAIKSIIKPDNNKSLCLLKELYNETPELNLYLIGSRLLFNIENENTDYDFLVHVKSNEDVLKLFHINKSIRELRRYDKKYFNKKAEEYAKVSFTSKKSLIKVSRSILFYFFCNKHSKEIAFFPFYYNSDIHLLTIELLTKLNTSSLPIIKIEGNILSDFYFSTFSFPRIFEVCTENKKYSIFSFLWRLNGIGFFSNNQKVRIRIIGFLLPNSIIWLGGEGTFWEII